MWDLKGRKAGQWPFLIGRIPISAEGGEEVDLFLLGIASVQPAAQQSNSPVIQQFSSRSPAAQQSIHP